MKTEKLFEELSGRLGNKIIVLKSCKNIVRVTVHRRGLKLRIRKSGVKVHLGPFEDHCVCTNFLNDKPQTDLGRENRDG